MPLRSLSFASTRGHRTSGGCPLGADRSRAENEPVRVLRDSNNKERRGLTPLRSLSFASTRGFEPPTYRLGGGRSILLSYVDKSILKINSTLKPNITLKPTTFLRLTQEVLTFHTDIKLHITAADAKQIQFLVGNRIDQLIVFENLT